MKRNLRFTILHNRMLSAGYCEIKVGLPDCGQIIPHSVPGQFVQIKVPNSPSTLLRRPISICDADSDSVTFLIRKAGAGTAHLMEMKPGEKLEIILPLGNGFTIGNVSNVLLIGGGVGIAPMHYLGKKLSERGISVEYLLGARTADMLLLKDELKKTGTVHITTDDGSEGVKGVVTDHPVLSDNRKYDRIYCCGPAPMMKAVACRARKLSTDCEVSLENMMACGFGACLCCVENTTRGNVCVCTEGPVFNINELTW